MLINVVKGGWVWDKSKSKTSSKSKSISKTRTRSRKMSTFKKSRKTGKRSSGFLNEPKYYK
jgi:hypothetical protein